MIDFDANRSSCCGGVLGSCTMYNTCILTARIIDIGIIRDTNTPHDIVSSAGGYSVTSSNREEKKLKLSIGIGIDIDT